MARYFLEVGYKGTRYSGSQIQDNANSVQAELENALFVYFRHSLSLTGSSRTDAGVHALHNFYHFDMDATTLTGGHSWHKPDGRHRFLYNINAILPADIVIHNIHNVADDAHSRFLAISREYKYLVYQQKDPFLEDRAYYFPYQLDLEAMQSAAQLLLEYKDFTSFSKRNTQVKTFLCNIEKGEWSKEGNTIRFNIKGNRFLRGMVRGLAGTMLQVGRGKISVKDFAAIIEAKDCRKADFSTPPHALFLVAVNYPSGTF